MTRSSRCLVTALLLASLLLLLSACGSPSPTLHSGVQGKGMITGGPKAGSRPDPGVTVAVHRGDLHGAIVAKVKADSSGAFRVDLPPGTYTLVEVSGSAVPRTVTVEPGKYVKVTLRINAL
jgi:hypothetical protein